MSASFPSLCASRPAHAAALWLGVLGVACAQTWDGGAANNNWNTPSNWTPDAAPAANAHVTFSGSVRLTPNLNSSRSVSSLTFASGASAFTLGSANGSVLTVGTGGLTQASPSTQTITHALTLGASQTWNLSGGDLAVSGPISSGFVTLTKTGSGNLNLSGNNSGLQGPLVVNAGTVTLANSNALGSFTYGNTVASGATLALTGGITLTEGDLFLSGAGASSGGALRSVSGANTLAADLKLNASSTVAADAGTLTLANTVALNGHTLTLAGSGAIVTSQPLNSGGTVVTTGSGARTFNSNINAAFTVSGSGPVVVNQSINAGSGTVTLGGSGSVTLNGAQLNAGNVVVAGSTAVASSATLNLGGGSLTVAGSGSVAFDGPAINVGGIAVTGSGATSFGSQINASGGSFTQSGTGTTTFDGSGTNFFSSVNVTGGTLVLDQNGGAAFQVSGAINISDAEVFFAGDNQIAGFNSVTLGDGATLYLGNTDQSFANLTITGDSILDFGGGGSSLDIANLNIVGDSTLTIVNWNGAVDYFLVDVNPGSTTLGQVIFADFAGSTWNSDGSVTAIAPVPEPAAYGLGMLGGLAALAAFRRRPRPRRLQRDTGAPLPSLVT